MLYKFIEKQNLNINEIVIEALKTEKNMPIINFLAKNPLLENLGGNKYFLNTKK